MRSISKAMIAVMIAAAMCVVPLFVIEDSEAYVVKKDSAGVSAETGSMEPADFYKLIPEEGVKEMVFPMLLGPMIGDTAYGIDSFKLNKVTDLKLARGTEVTDDTQTDIDGSTMTLNFDMTVTKMLAPASIEVPYDGFQDLYRAFNDMPVGHKLIFKDCTITIKEYSKEVTKFAINNDKNFVFTERDTITSMSVKVSCNDIQYKNADDVKNLKFEYEMARDFNKCIKLSFYSADFKDEVKIENVVGTTNTFKLNDNRDCAQKAFIKYNYDGKDYSYSSTKDHYDGTDTTDVKYDVLTASEAGAIMTRDMAPPEYLFCGEDTPAQKCLFDSSEVDASVNTNEKMKTFLQEKGTIGESYSDASNVANASATSVPTGSSGNNIVFYVIIGVLAVAVVALAVLMIKKK